MMRSLNPGRAGWLGLLRALAVSACVAGAADAAAPRIDEKELSAVGFKVLVATTKAQQDWLRSLAPGQIRPMQRNGKHFFIYPDAARNQVYVGGPNEYEAYRQAHPERPEDVQDAAAKGRASRAKQDKVMREATARDLSDPFLGVGWADLGW